MIVEDGILRIVVNHLVKEIFEKSKASETLFITLKYVKQHEYKGYHRNN